MMDASKREKKQQQNQEDASEESPRAKLILPKP